jgi:hypothetical protein
MSEEPRRARIWIDGRLVDEGEAGVAADDHGVTTGDGCFETLKVVDGTPFALTRHVARLRSNRIPALTVNRSPIVMASLANAEAVRETPPTLDGGLEMRSAGCPLMSRYLTPVGMRRLAT